MSIISAYTPDLHNIVQLDGGIATAFGMVLILGAIGAAFGLGAYVFERLIMFNKAFDELSVEMFKAHWSHQTAHVGVETDYHALESAFQSYFYNEHSSPSKVVKQLSTVLVIQALKGNLTLTPSLLDQLQARVMNIQAMVDELTEKQDTEAPKTTGRYGSPYDYVIEGVDIGSVDMSTVVLPQNPNDQAPENSKTSQRQKAMALVLAEVLSFGVEAPAPSPQISQ